MLASNKVAISSYRKAGVAAEAGRASPHKVVLALFDGALGRLAVAAGAIQRNELAMAGEEISTVLTILGSLQQSLDFDGGGDVAVNLDRLYDYMIQTLLKANLNKDVDGIAEVRELLTVLRDGWSDAAVATSAQQAAAAL